MPANAVSVRVLRAAWLVGEGLQVHTTTKGGAVSTRFDCFFAGAPFHDEARFEGDRSFADVLQTWGIAEAQDPWKHVPCLLCVEPITVLVRAGSWSKLLLRGGLSRAFKRGRLPTLLGDAQRVQSFFRLLRESEVQS